MLKKKDKPYEMYWSGSLDDSKICPKCGAVLENKNQAYLVTVKVGEEQDSYVMGDPDAGYFCINCPVAVLDEDVFEEMLRASIATYYPNARSFEFAVAGIVDFDAVPEDKRDEELGTDDNPLPIIPLKEQLIEDVADKRLPISGKIGRNDPCPCGSGKKYKKCCGKWA